MEPNLSQALHLLNGDTTAQRIAAGQVVANMLTKKFTPTQVIEELYVRCLSRKPLPAESAKFAELLKSEKDSKKALEDVFWAILNCKEFMFNH